MNTLFTISKTPSSELLEACLHAASSGDCVLFIEDGVYHGINHKALASIPDDIEVFYLKEDLIARGLADRIVKRCQPASYRRFVELCTQYSKVVSWF